MYATKNAIWKKVKHAFFYVNGDEDLCEYSGYRDKEKKHEFAKEIENKRLCKN